MSSRRRVRPRRTNIPAVVKRVLNQQTETKYWQDSTTYQNLAPSTSGNIYSLSTQIVQGDSGATRDGNVVHVKSLAFDGYCYVADSPYNILRIMVVQNRGIALGTGDMPTVSTQYNPYKMTVLYDKKIPLFWSGATAGQLVPKTFKVRVPLNKRLMWNASTGACYNRDIYLYVVTDSSAGPNPTIYGSLTVPFKDL